MAVVAEKKHAYREFRLVGPPLDGRGDAPASR